MPLNKLLSLIVFIIFLSCSANDDPQNFCIGKSRIEEISVCIELYEPVCGCNGVTYPNSCYALNFNGVISFTEGECK